MKNRLVAAMLALFGGAIGVHKFYLRKPGTGIFYFFMFMVFLNAKLPIMVLIGLFEGLRLLMMSDQDFNRKYNPEMSQQDQNWEQSRQRQYRWENRNQQQPQQPGQTNQNQSRGWKNIEVTNQAGARRNIFKESAIRKYKDFDLTGAIEDFQKSLQMEPKDIATHFNIACAYSLTEQANKAYYHISKAVEYGFNDYEKLSTHDDLAFVRIQNQWDDFKNGGFKSYTAFEKNPYEQPKAEPQNDVLLEQLNKLDELRKKGLLSENEYALEKKKLNG